MSVRIGSGRFTAGIDPFGAELKSLFDGQEQTEYMWDGDPRWWEGTAPVLFPIIGGLHRGVYRYNRKEYSLGSHGFARKKQFELLRCTSDEAVFALHPDKETKAIYPFDFCLTVLFAMDFSGISVRYEVTNLSSTEDMFFSIGSHPAFLLPFAGGVIENYYIHFDQTENAQRYYFKDGCITEDTGEAFHNSRQIFLNRTMFNDGPIIFKDIKSRDISICKSRSEKRITVNYDAPFLALWSKPKGAPFLCIEPWHGIPDPLGFEGPIEEKPGIRKLGPGETFTTGYAVQIL